MSGLPDDSSASIVPLSTTCCPGVVAVVAVRSNAQESRRHLATNHMERRGPVNSLEATGVPDAVL